MTLEKISSLVTKVAVEMRSGIWGRLFDGNHFIQISIEPCSIVNIGNYFIDGYKNTADYKITLRLYKMDDPGFVPSNKLISDLGGFANDLLCKLAPLGNQVLSEIILRMPYCDNGIWTAEIGVKNKNKG